MAKDIGATIFMILGITQKGGSIMRFNLEDVLSWAEKIATAVNIVVPATRKLRSLFTEK